MGELTDPIQSTTPDIRNHEKEISLITGGSTVIAVGALSAADVLHNGVERDNEVFSRGAVPKEREQGGGHASDVLLEWLGVLLEEQQHVVAEGALGVTCVGERLKIVDLWRQRRRPTQRQRRRRRQCPLPLLGGRKNRHFSIVRYKFAHSVETT
jgi:hypothetical protein